MKALVLLGSPRPQGNTAALTAILCDQLQQGGVQTEVLSLYEKEILPCVACRGCQQDWSAFACVWKDDVAPIAEKILDCDLMVLATPIYSWYCTPPMKALLDRLVYGMNKYYGERRGPSLWKGKALALLETCGYPPDKGCDLLEEGIRRYCRHSGLRYLGSHAERHESYAIPFVNAEKEQRTRAFALRLLDALRGCEPAAADSEKKSGSDCPLPKGNDKV